MIRHLFWDWNGTLLDDVDCCIDTLNTLLAERSMPRVTRGAYRSAFGFPVRDYYAGLGFDFAREDFAALSVVFIARYRERLARVSLHAAALSLMATTRTRVVSQQVVSAMEHGLLGTLLEHYAVAPHLDGFHGTGNLQADSKIDIGRQALHRLGAPPEEVLLIGDTAHDHELAQELGCACVLFSGGHQARERLVPTGRPIIDDIEQVLGFLDAEP